jgi:predicted DNA-binding antitoxin AbrB/MazE fold protein
MTTTIEVVYENGVLRPLTPLALLEGQHVQVVLATTEMTDPISPSLILAEIAALPVEGGGDPLTSRDHDHVLYGKSAS